MAVTVGLAACGSSGSSSGTASSSSSSSASSSLVVETSFVLKTLDPARMFEPTGLMIDHVLYDTLLTYKGSNVTTPVPDLATSYTASADAKTYTFTLRSGVKFANGDPVTATDVVFSLMRTKNITGNPSFLMAGITATAPNASTVVLASATPNTAIPAILTNPALGIVDAKKVQAAGGSDAANAATADKAEAALNTTSEGSGPYTLTSYSTTTQVVLTANPNYWQPGLPKIKKIEYPAYTSNTTANNDLANGTAQWGAQYIPAINTFYKSKSPSYNYWFPPTVNVSLVPNLTNPLLSNVKVREAMSYAIDRAKVSTIGESGYEPPANQTGIVTPTFASSQDSAAVSAWGNGYDPAKATSLLESAGFHMGSDGIMVNSAGQKLAFSVLNIGDYSDWVASVQVIQQELKAVGIAITPDNLSNTDFVSEFDYGKYQLAYYDQQSFGPSAYYELNNWLNSANTAPVGKLAGSNFERYSNPATDKLLNQYATTTDPATQQSILNQVQQVMTTDVPIIPVVEAVDWYQYDTSSFSGWPTSSNPYAQPPVWAFPDNEQVLLHLSPK